MRTSFFCLVIGIFTTGFCKAQTLKPIDTAAVFYVVAKNNSGVIYKIMGGDALKNLVIEEMVPAARSGMQSDVSNMIVIKCKVNVGAEAELAKIKSKISLIEGVVYVGLKKNRYL